jgi:cytochrome c biogenesis protein
MSTIQHAVKNPAITAVAAKPSRASLINRFLDLLCSVRFGIVLLVLLAAACMVGMLVMQQSVDGFDRYFAELTPAQKLVYSRLDLFDIYHSWYFNALVAVLALNIILSSIDRFPKAWKFFSRPTVSVPVRWLKDQKQTASLEMPGDADTVAGVVSSQLRSSGWRRIHTKIRNGKTYVLGESGVCNRLGAYAVHVALLVVLIGGFMTGQLGSTGQMPLQPGQTTNLMYDTVVNLDKTEQVTKMLPFQVYCTDLQQKLIKKDESISAMNTIDWITRFTIKDETGTHEAMVQMNRPFDYRGYRFFQASFIPVGRARSITLNVTPENGQPQQITIPRDGTASLEDGTKIKFSEFRGDFTVGEENPDENTGDYPNPGAILQVTKPQTAYAFGSQMTDIPVAKKPVAGYTFQLADFEKVSDQHILSVQRDPGATVVYVGFGLLFLTLVGVFFFSHQRVWGAIEPSADGTASVTFGGNTNRSANAFEEKFKKFINSFGGVRQAVKPVEE